MATKVRRPRIGEVPRVEMTILGSACDSTSKDDWIHYTWREGPVLVEIVPSFDSDKREHDYCCSISFFAGDKDSDASECTLQVWRRTAELCANYADRKLAALRNVLVGKVTAAKKAHASERYE